MVIPLTTEQRKQLRIYSHLWYDKNIGGVPVNEVLIALFSPEILGISPSDSEKGLSWAEATKKIINYRSNDPKFSDMKWYVKAKHNNRNIIFAKTYEAVINLINKCESVDRRREFLLIYGQQLQEYFKVDTTVLQKTPQAFNLFQEITCNDCEGFSFLGVIDSYGTFQTFLMQYEKETCTSWVLQRTKILGADYLMTFQCIYAGAPYWAQDDKPSTTQHKSVKVFCHAEIKVRLSYDYAKEQHLVKEGAQEKRDKEPNSTTDHNCEQHAMATIQASLEEPGASCAPERVGTQTSNTLVKVELHLKHCNHEPGTPADVQNLPIDPEIAAFIQELTMDGLDFKAINNQLKKKANSIIERDGLKVCEDIDTRYFPKEKTIRNIITQAIGKSRLDKNDQESVRQFVNQKIATALPGDRWYLQLSNDSTDQLFLLVHQSEQQRRMMDLYGQTIVGMDATYKTSKWGFPMYIMNVITNHGHGYPVAVFFVQEETTAMLTKALQKIKDWNPNWQPKYFMVDKSEQELGAIEEAFNGEVEALLCTFHRLQAWNRWLSKSANGIPQDRKPHIFKALVTIGDAPTEDEFNALVDKFKGTNDYKSNKRLQSYMEDNWFNCTKLWAACYRQTYHGGIDTNNYLESMNRTIKGKFLADRPDERLDSLLHTWLTRILPYYDRANVLDNVNSVRWANMTRETSLPNWAHGRPRPIVEALLLRQSRALNMDSEFQRVGSADEMRFWVRKSDDTLKTMYRRAGQSGSLAPGVSLLEFTQHLDTPQLHYEVNIRNGTCTCPDALLSHTVCKHMFVVISHSEIELSFNDLPHTLIGSPRMVLDSACCPELNQNLQQPDSAELLTEHIVRDIIEETGMDPTMDDDFDLPDGMKEQATMWRIRPKSRAAALRREALDLMHVISSLVYGASEDVLQNIKVALQDVHRLARLGNEWTGEGQAFAEPRQEIRPLPQQQDALQSGTQIRRESSIVEKASGHQHGTDFPTGTPVVSSEFVVASQPGRKRAVDKRAFPLAHKIPEEGTGQDLPPSTSQRTTTSLGLVTQVHGLLGNASPPSKKIKSKNTAIGTTPNPHMFAVPLREVELQPNFKSLQPPTAEMFDAVSDNPSMYKDVKQRTKLWSQLREGMVTSSRLPYLLGFSEPSSAKALGIAGTHWKNHQRTIQCFQEVFGATTGGEVEGTPAMQWGIAHEPNCHMLLLKKHREISFLKDYDSVALQEYGISCIDNSNIAADLEIDPISLGALPKLGASPDGVLHCFSSDGTQETYGVEYKSYFPFKSLEQGDGFVYTGETAEPKGVLPHYFAQCQLTMLSLNCTKLLLCLYGPFQTKVFLIERDLEWNKLMLQIIAQLNADFVVKKRMPSSKSWTKFPRYHDLLARTKELCALASLRCCSMPSYNSVDDMKFLF